MTNQQLSGPAAMLRRLLPTLLGNIVLPYGVYLVAHGFGVADVPALALSALPALVMILAGVVRNRRIDVIGVVVLITIALGIGTSLLTGDARFAVAKDSILPLGVGLAMLGSLAATRPLLYHLLRALRGEDTALRGQLERLWNTSTGFRAMLRRYTVLWAGVLMFAVALRLVLAFTLPVSTSLPLLQVLEPIVWLVLVFLTRRGVRPWLRSAPSVETAVPVSP